MLLTYHWAWPAPRRAAGKGGAVPQVLGFQLLRQGRVDCIVGPWVPPVPGWDVGPSLGQIFLPVPTAPCESSLVPLPPVQVWKYPKVWEGFIKCCQRTKPQSFQVILQLPPQQLGAVFDKCPELREPLLAHVRSFTPHQVPRVWGCQRQGQDGEWAEGSPNCHRRPGTPEGQSPGVWDDPERSPGRSFPQRPLLSSPASTYPQLHHDHLGGQRQAGARGQGGACRAPGRGEGHAAAHLHSRPAHPGRRGYLSRLSPSLGQEAGRGAAAFPTVSTVKRG
jgi:hypothetical protein